MLTLVVLFNVVYKIGTPDTGWFPFGFAPTKPEPPPKKSNALLIVDIFQSEVWPRASLMALELTNRMFGNEDSYLGLFANSCSKP